MHKILVLYDRPADEGHFRSYYANSHIPLARQLPDLLSSEYSFSIEELGGGEGYFAIWSGEWADEAAANAALASEIGQKVIADSANYTQAGMRIIRYNTE
ncbi:MAG: EthD family reductase [Sphingobium sp.]